MTTMVHNMATSLSCVLPPPSSCVVPGRAQAKWRVMQPRAWESCPVRPALTRTARPSPSRGKELPMRHRPPPRPPRSHPAPPQPRDPVCGAAVDVTRPPGGTFLHGRFQYAFCADACRERFAAAPDAFLAKDPVCGMDANPFAPRGGTHEHAGKAFHFCSMRCLERFRADPESFLAGGPKGMEGLPPPPAGAEVVWVCPMDPEVRENPRSPAPSAEWRSSRWRWAGCRSPTSATPSSRT